jgi:murein DD-endopeptidase MepM/ murein hydrolase activator NlpD
VRRAVKIAAVGVVLIAIALAWRFSGKIRAFYYRNYTEVRVVDDSDWFDYPVGAPNAKGYYRAQRFGGRHEHLGEDWNGMGGGDSDCGDPIYSIAGGRVSYVGDAGGGWGNVVRIVHPVDRAHSVEAVYAHLSETGVRKGQSVRRGQVIGNMGNVNGLYQAHLHLEIRSRVGAEIGRGYGEDPDHIYLDPSRFIDMHRKRRPS